MSHIVNYSLAGQVPGEAAGGEGGEAHQPARGEAGQHITEDLQLLSVRVD